MLRAKRYWARRYLPVWSQYRYANSKPVPGQKIFTDKVWMYWCAGIQKVPGQKTFACRLQVSAWRYWNGTMPVLANGIRYVRYKPGRCRYRYDTCMFTGISSKNLSGLFREPLDVWDDFCSFIDFFVYLVFLLHSQIIPCPVYCC